MIPLRRALLPLVSFAVLLAGCAGPTGDRSATGTTRPAAAVHAEEMPEPLPHGIKPLTLEQEEMISQ